jgi:hypothetical protein
MTAFRYFIVISNFSENFVDQSCSLWLVVFKLFHDVLFLSQLLERTHIILLSLVQMILHFLLLLAIQQCQLTHILLIETTELLFATWQSHFKLF